MSGIRIAVLAVIAVLATLVVGCGGGTASQPANEVPTMCGGSTAWPPSGHGPAPAGVTVAAWPPDGARVQNDSTATWWYRASAWELGACTGWISLEPAVLGSVAPRGSAKVRVAGPTDGSPFRVGVELWPCDPAGCRGDPAGFAWAGGGTPSPSP